MTLNFSMGYCMARSFIIQGVSFSLHGDYEDLYSVPSIQFRIVPEHSTAEKEIR